MLTVGSLFAGIGGFDIGLERAGMKVLWQSEIDPFAAAVLRKHWPHVPNHGDIRTIHAGSVERVDVLCGGFPCQDISLAGAGGGIEGERSGLWREFARVIGELRPNYALVENVGALTGRGLASVLGDLAALGFDAQWHVIPAAAVDAPHLRERVWIVAADANSERIRQHQQRDERRRDDLCDGGHAELGDDGAPRDAPHADAGRCEGFGEPQHSGEQRAPGDQPDRLGEAGRGGRTDASNPASERMERSGAARFQIAFAQACARLLGRDDAGAFWLDGPAVAPIRRVDDGVPARLDRGRLSCLGNAIVPQIAEILGRALIEAHTA